MRMRSGQAQGRDHGKDHDGSVDERSPSLAVDDPVDSSAYRDDINDLIDSPHSNPTVDYPIGDPD